MHYFDLMAGGVEVRLSTSKYGAFEPAPTAQGVLLTRYDRRGYTPARLVESAQDTVLWTLTPKDVVNPSRRMPTMINLDKVHYTPKVEAEQQASHPAKRFRKALRGVNLHSWAPTAFDPYETIDEHTFNPLVGLTLLSQNLLSNTEAYASYGWDELEQSIFKVGLRNSSLGVQLGLDATYGGAQQVYSVGYYDAEKEANVYQPLPNVEEGYSVTASATLPLLFDRGRALRQLSFGVGWSYTNGQVADLDALQWSGSEIANIGAVGYNKGLHKLALSVAFVDQLKLAHRDFLPRLGYRLQMGYSLNPTNADFASTFVGYGSVYLPGFGAHHSIQLGAAYQQAVGGYRYPSGSRPLTYRSSTLIPRGFSSSYFPIDEGLKTLSATYRMPLCYPEWGIPSVLYIKRIRLGAGFDYARFGYHLKSYNAWSAGGEVSFDFNVLRMPSAATSSLTLKWFYTSTSKQWISASLGLPF